MSSKNLCQTRLPPPLHHKVHFAYEWVVSLIAADNSTGLRIEYNALGTLSGKGPHRDSTSLLGATGGSGPTVAVYLAVRRLVKLRRCVISEVNQTCAHHATTSMLSRA